MDFDLALQIYMKYLAREYRNKNTRRNYYRFTKQALEWINKHRGKNDTDNITPEDTGEYRAWCIEKFKINGNVSRLWALNHFTRTILKKEELGVSVPGSVSVNKPVMSKEELEKYIRSARDPLEYLVAILEIDGLLRPTEICMMNISNIDFENQKLYLDDTKTGDNYIIMSPRLMKALQNYLPYRCKPRRKEDTDKLIIIPKGSHRGLAPQNDRGDFVYNATKRIAARAGFTRSIYPYLVKPSSITNDLNNHVNPKIVQRKARHRRLESTLRYDHTNDEMVREHFNETCNVNNIDSLKPEDKIRVMFDRYIAGDVDKETLKSGIDIYDPEKRRRADVAYG